MALFELTELASYLQDDLDTSSATLARELATGLVEEVTGPLESQESTIVLPVWQNGIVELPMDVVTAVTSVVDNLSNSRTFTWQRPYPVLHIEDWDPPVTLDEWGYVTVTLTHGYTVVPVVAKAVALAVAARAYTIAPPPGVSYQIDDYRESTSSIMGESGTSVITLTEYERMALAGIGGRNAVVTKS